MKLRQKPVTVLHYTAAEKGRTSPIERKIDGARILEELEGLGLNCGEIKSRVCSNGNVLMYYNDLKDRKTTLSINGKNYCGNVVFVGMNRAEVTDLTRARIRAIKLVVKRG